MGENSRFMMSDLHVFFRFFKNKKSSLVFFLIILFLCVVACIITLLALSRSDTRHETSDEDLTLQWWQKAIVYQVYPRSFQDSNGDGTGDLRGIKSRLQYLKDIGVGAVWLSPFYKSPMKDFGYDVSDYKQVDPLFGSQEDFDELLLTAHMLGLKFIVDFVPNHCSDQHDWFKLSLNKTGKYKDYFIWREPKSVLQNGTRVPPNNWLSVFGGSAWEWDATRRQYYYHAFLKSQPDLNYHDENVKKDMDDILRFWINKGVDGFRLDAIPHLFEKSNLSYEVKPDDNEPHGYKYTKSQPEIFDVVKRWRGVLDEYEKKDGKVRWLLAETFEIPSEDREKYYNAGSTPFDFDLVTVMNICNKSVDAKCIRKIIMDGVNLTEGMWPNLVTGNHDNWRVSDRIGPEFVDAMNMLLLTLPGTPTTYYGEEIGMRNGNYSGQQPKDTFAISSGDWSNSRDPERNPMQWNTSANAGFTSGTPWLAVTSNTDYMHINVETESKYENSTLGIYKTLARLRQNPAFLNARIEFPAKDDNILSYTRASGSHKYLVVINFGQNTITFSIDSDQPSGTVVAATSGIFYALNKIIDLKAMSLEKGDGLVIRLS